MAEKTNRTGANAPRKHAFSHGTVDRALASPLLADEDFRTAFSTCCTLLGTCFLTDPADQEFQQALRACIDAVESAGWPFGKSEHLEHATGLLAAGVKEETAGLHEDWKRLFRGPGHLLAAPWGSVYMDRDQVMYGWTWVALHDWLAKHGIRGAYAENDPEDNFGRMLFLAGELAANRPELLGELLADHLLCWSPRFLQTVGAQAQTSCYRGLAVLAAATLDDVQGLLGIVPAQRRMFR